MSQQIIQPSTADPSVRDRSTGYEYTVGPKPSLPDEHMRSPLTSRLYAASLAAGKQQVSLAAMTFLFQEMIAYLHKNCTSVTEFEGRLSAYGESIGTKLLELLNLRSSVAPGSSSRTSTFLSSSSQASTVAGSATAGSATARSRSGTVTSSRSGATASTHTGTAPSAGPASAASHSNGNSTADSHSHHTHAHIHQTESLTSQITRMRRRDLKILDILQFVHGTLWSYLFDHVSDDLVKSSERNTEYMIIDNHPPLTQFISGANNRVSCDYFVCGIIRGFLTDAGFRCKVTAHTMPQGTFDNRTVYLIQFDNQVLERENIRFGQASS